MTVVLDDPAVNLVPVQASSSTVQPENPTPLVAKSPHRIHPLVPVKRPPNLVLDEDYACETFKGIITDIEVSACYDMSVKDFERFAIHDLFKVCSFLPILILFFYEIYGKILILLRPSVFQAMPKFYTASSQTKELYDKAKAAKAKSKELRRGR